MQGSFEKDVQRKMEELRLQPSVPVWEKIELEIAVEKKRRRGIIWLFLAVSFLGGAGGWLAYHSLRPTSPQASQQPKQGRTETPSAPSSSTVAEKENAAKPAINFPVTKITSVQKPASNNTPFSGSWRKQNQKGFLIASKKIEAGKLSEAIALEETIDTKQPKFSTTESNKTSVGEPPLRNINASSQTDVSSNLNDTALLVKTADPVIGDSLAAKPNVLQEQPMQRADSVLKKKAAKAGKWEK
ncbi:MAG TPA: hypothetical protein VM871_09450, partial [Flavisolibacter sp.]|nr:hypothetical protein [Flavisolibacter sp.]